MALMPSTFVSTLATEDRSALREPCTSCTALRIDGLPLFSCALTLRAVSNSDTTMTDDAKRLRNMLLSFEGAREDPMAATSTPRRANQCSNGQSPCPL